MWTGHPGPMCSRSFQGKETLKLFLYRTRSEGNAPAEECSDWCVPIGRKARKDVAYPNALTGALAIKAPQIKGHGLMGSGSFQAYQSEQMRAEVIGKATAGRAPISCLRGGS